jgi:S-adenosylmethionine-diacylglycerol 3-amino-3-carboxypropyl transferase
MNTLVLPRQAPSLSDRFDQKVFDAIYSRALVYNTCWEDPAVDRRALTLTSDDCVLVITSAGCNALDYAIAGPRRVHAVDANPRQNALLQLKIAGIRALEYEDYFQLFGEGFHPRFREIYGDALRRSLSPFAQDWWDARAGWFSDSQRSFFYCGLSGLVARGFRASLAMNRKLRTSIHDIFLARDLDTQRGIYDDRVRRHLFSPLLKWVLSRQITMSLLGVPHSQRRQVEAQHARGVAGFVQEAVDYVFRELPARDNYFWSVYVHGRYTRECCPEYLKPAGFAALKAGLADRIMWHTATVTEFLERGSEPISRFVLLDHMDWMGAHHPHLLLEEWQAISRRAAPSARVIFRSAHRNPPYLDAIRIGDKRLRDHLVFDDALAAELTRGDRVHTYAGFHIGHFPT